MQNPVSHTTKFNRRSNKCIAKNTFSSYWARQKWNYQRLTWVRNIYSPKNNHCRFTWRAGQQEDLLTGRRNCIMTFTLQSLWNSLNTPELPVLRAVGEENEQIALTSLLNNIRAGALSQELPQETVKCFLLQTKKMNRKDVMEPRKMVT